ncbi:helix-turn-helix domain-containing protein [Microbacterium foliorum]|uniref:helix-turn-helix domain-containing protein n=1 Tax=Microbacterium foliorum TaxID=104336 RepID=UPI003736F3C6
MPTKVVAPPTPFQRVPIARKARRNSARIGKYVLEELSESWALRVTTTILGYEDRCRKRPFVSRFIARELFECIAPCGWRGIGTPSPPSCPGHVRHDHHHNRGRTHRACPAARPRCPKGGQHTCRVERVRRKSIVSYGQRNYGIQVSPYQASFVESLDSVTTGAGEGETEWREFTQELAVRLRRLRRDVGLSQEDVAHRANLSRFIYRQYEQGESRRGTPANPSLRAVIAIGQVLGVSITELLPDTFPDLRRR